MQSPSPKLDRLLTTVWRRAQQRSLLKGLSVLCTWAAAIFLAAFAIDWLLHLSMPVRLVILAILLGLSISKAWRNGWSGLKSINLTHCALIVEGHYRTLESLLVTAVQLRTGKLSPGASKTMAEETIQAADRAAVPLRAAEVVPFKVLQPLLLRAALLIGVILIIGIVNSPMLAAALARIFTPWQAVAYPTRTHIALAAETITVKEGDSVAISAALSGEIPHDATLFLRTGEGKPRSRKLEVVDSACAFDMAAAFRSFDYRLKAGDAETPWHSVTVVSSPRIEKSQIRLHFPAYTKRPVENMESMTLTVPEGTRIEWDLTLDRAVTGATVTIEGQAPVPLQLSADGLTARHEIEAAASTAYFFTWVEKAHGFTFNSAKYYLQVAPDQAPRIELLVPGRNLFATLKRKLDIAYRVRDDHGIDNSAIAFRHNNIAEQQLSVTGTQGEAGVLNLNWDYHDTLPDLAVGDTVTLAIEVTDFYPGPDGPHRVRSESRRITFLTKEDYLRQISAQKERLLGQLRAVYRQQRAAYDVIRNLNPADDAFEQTCFLESSRQDMLNERIMGLNTNIQELLEDLIANSITDEAELAGLRKLKTSLQAITETLMSEAAAKLRELGPAKSGTADGVAAAAATINQAARELGSLVLQLGINQATEVFARELHVIAQTQGGLRVETLESKGANTALATRQAELADWLTRLLNELSSNRDYSTSPLAVIRLSRMVKDLRAAAIEPAMRDAAKRLADGDPAAAAQRQDRIINDVFRLECYIRVGAEFDALVEARDLFTGGINDLNGLARDNADMTAPQFTAARADIAERITKLYSAARLLILPPIPAPIAELLDQAPPKAPPVDELLDAAKQALQSAARSAAAGERDAAFTQQRQASEALEQLNAIIARRIAEKSKTARYGAYATDALEQVRGIRELFAGQLRLLEKTEDAEADSVSGDYLAPAQLHLSQEVKSVQRQMTRKSRDQANASALVPAMIELLSQAAVAMEKAAPALQANKLAEAIEHQDAAMRALKRGIALAQHESNGWLGLTNLLIVTEGAGLPAKYMDDIAAEQESLIAATKDSTPETRPQLIDMQQVLARAVPDVMLLLDAAGEGLDFEQALLFASSDMGASAIKLAAGEAAAAMGAQASAVESLKEVAGKLQSAEKQYYYFITALEFLQERLTDGAVVLNTLSQVRDELETPEVDKPNSSTEHLAELNKATNRFCSLLFQATGRNDYTVGRDHLAAAVKALAAGKQDDCVEQLTSAEDALKASMDELQELIQHIGAIPEIVPAEAPEEFHVMLDMVTLLLDQKALALTIARADVGDLAARVPELQELNGTGDEFLARTRQNALIVAAQKASAEALAHLTRSARDETLASLYESETRLCQCVLEYALYYVEPKHHMGGKKKKRGKSGTVDMFKLSTKLKQAYDKNWGGVEGEDPKEGRSEWEVLGSRDRAALNENFVRELPLEYREILKDYYERLAK